MPEILGADWSFAHIDPKLLVAAGYKYAFRYLAPLPNGKVITRAEYEADQAAGLKVVLNFEQGATQMMSGFSQGHQDGLVVLGLKKAIGAPLTERTIYSFDADDRAWSGWQDRLDQYLRAAEGVSGHAEGVYGSIRVIEEMKRRNPARETWQTQAWSGDVVSPLADFYQRTGHTHFVPGVNNNEYDEDVVIHTAPGGKQVPTNPATFNPPPVIVSITEFEHATLGHCAAGVTANGAVYCSPANAYLGGGNHGASSGKNFEDAGRKAGVIRRPTKAENASGLGYVIVAYNLVPAGEHYIFVRHP
jgi:Domain of unknown function (DUF1906)